jgi:tetratricopeptide (TPR) repeat protein
VLAGLGRHEEAIELYRGLLAEGAGWPHLLHISLAHSLRAAGRTSETIEAYRAAAACRPSFGDAYWGLADLKTYRFEPGEIAQMRALEADPATPAPDRSPLCFAIGKALEDRGEYGESWSYYELGNALKRAGSRYRPEFTEMNTRRQIEVCTTEFFAARAGSGLPARDPIFIVGLPRSGSTLVEQILACHSRIEGTQELDDIPRLVLELQGPHPDPLDPRYPRVLTELAREEFARLGQRYLDGTRIHRREPDRRPFFIDKMPNNFRHVGLIHLALPNARIIDVRREPMACCLGNLKQLFANGQEFSYGIEGIARYYRTYLELMRHWEAVLPGRVLRLHYEDLVDDLDGGVRRLLDHCEVEFEPRCLEFHKSARGVRTASSEQVRQPLYRDGLSQWRRYEPWLDPLVQALGDARSRYRD